MSNQPTGLRCVVMWKSGYGLWLSGCSDDLLKIGKTLFEFGTDHFLGAHEKAEDLSDQVDCDPLHSPIMASQRFCISSGETFSISCWSIHCWPYGSITLALRKP